MKETHLTPREAALEYISRGWAVLPLHFIIDGKCSCEKPGCKSRGKHPFSVHGVTDASKEPEQVEAWWNQWPSANVGVATGAISNLVVVDADGSEGIEAARQLLGDPFAYPSVQTGSGGFHFYFLHPGAVIRNSASKIAPYLDIRGDGGYCVAPPSSHVNGDTYRWLNAVECQDLPQDLLNLIYEPTGLGVTGPAYAADQPVIVQELLRRGHKPVSLNTQNVVYRCPFPDHQDEHPSFTVDLQTGRFICFGCGRKGTVTELCEGLDQFMRQGVVCLDEQTGSLAHGPVVSPVFRRTPNASPSGLTLDDLIAQKALSLEVLQREGVVQSKYAGMPCVQVPYYSESGQCLAVRSRIALEGDRFRWRKGDRPVLYGLNHLEEFRAAGFILVVEGESDCWTAWEYGIPCIGVPGKTVWRSEWSELLAGLDVYVWQEPGAEDFIQSLHHDMPGLKVLLPPEGIKDLNDAHCAGHDVLSLVEQLKVEAKPASEQVRAGLEERIASLEQQAASVLSADDPLDIVKDAIRKAGYGGDLKAVVLTYLAATGRVLAMRYGSMPVHLLLVGPASSGKSYTVGSVLRLLPSDTYHAIDAGSPRVLIYGEDPLEHRLLVFSEADSLPAGEDNPAASAVRSLLQDHSLNYEVTEKDPKKGGFKVRKIHKPGPTTLITTSTKRLGAQLESRLFVVEVKDDQQQLAAALTMQAQLELHGPAADDTEGLLAFQSYLQMQAPWGIVVPFAEELSAYLQKQPHESRVARDFNRTLSLIKTVTVIRHRHRRTNAEGRLMAELDDYRTVHELVADVFETSSGASERVRETVEAVRRLVVGDSSVSQVEIAKELGLVKGTVSNRVRTAIRGGWLVDEETGRGKPAKIRLGEPLPERAGLPTPEELEALISRHNAEEGLGASSCQSDEPECSSVLSDTGVDDEWWDEDGCMTDKHLQLLLESLRRTREICSTPC
ncbi:MAG: bifunctional DNA primase/polymerase [Candidatus Marsarchaeota archaeon]|nr:bifunctional DNA primase/polymerase [Candidatus Marsarchaeota archaeon]